MKFILGKKQNMIQYFAENGTVYPATVITVVPNTVIRIKTPEHDGYTAVQFGVGAQKPSRVSAAVLGQTKQFGPFKEIKEFRISGDVSQAVGDIVDVSAFAAGDSVTISGVSKGKGFQGVVKRHGFHGGRRSHGQKHSEREPGSIGGGLRTRVPKGMRMGGRMGSDRVTIKNVKVLAVDAATQTLLVNGAIPGRRGTTIEVSA